MYEETACFDPNTVSEDGISQSLPPPPPALMAGSTTNSHNSFEQSLKLSMEELSYHHHPPQHHSHEDHIDASAAAIEIQLQHQLAFSTHLMHPQQDPCNQQLFSQIQSSHNWDPNPTIQDIQDMINQNPIDIQHNNNNGSDNFMGPSSLTETTPDLLNLFHSASSLIPNSSISFSNPNHPHKPPLTFVGGGGDFPMADTAASSSSVYDPLFHLNLPPQPPLFRDLFQSLPPPPPPQHGYTLGGGGALFGGGGGDDASSGGGGFFPDGDGVGQAFDNGILEFARDMACLGKGKKGGKITKHFATERERRERFNDKFSALRSLIPNPTKNDRASVVGDTIEYIKELLRTVNELKLLVEKKRCGRERNKRHKTEQDSTGDDGEMKPSNGGGDPDQCFSNGSLRSSWLQRKSKDTEVDVRIIHDEVTIKLVQRKKINCLLLVSKVLDELQLDLHHVASGHIGEYSSFLFNTKICEGSSVYASSIANKLIEVVDRQFASTPPTSCY